MVTSRSSMGEWQSVAHPPAQQYIPMATPQERIGSFTHQGVPPADQPLELLCEDHVGGGVRRPSRSLRMRHSGFVAKPQMKWRTRRAVTAGAANIAKLPKDR